MKNIGIIMAGGGGTRFWPLSRTETPKQLLALSGKAPMVTETAERLARVADGGIYVVSNETQAKKIKEVTKGLVEERNVLSEPAARNTAACIGYAAAKVMHDHGDGVMIVSPSDAYVRDTDEFARTLSVAAALAEKTDRPVTIGIKPTFPATGYGYIHRGEVFESGYAVRRFVEKPVLEKAEEYLRSGEYLWNSGIFVWKASVALDRIKKHLPELYEGLSRMQTCFGTEREEEVVKEIYPTLPSVSIDYGVMEKSSDILVVPADFGWNDVGSFDMLGVLHEADGNGNVSVGDVLALESKDSVFYSSTRTVAVVGVDNLVVVETPSVVMVCPKDKAQDVKKLVEELKRQGRKELL